MNHDITFTSNFITMITRLLESTIIKRLQSGKILIVLGPRQVGKTTLLKACLKDYDYLFLDGDDSFVRQQLDGISFSQLKLLIGEKRWILIDEAQRIKDVGLIAKMIHDQMPKVRVLLSGSSALELNQAIQEPLTGRKLSYQLYPVSWEELENQLGYLKANAQLEERLVFGMYPEIINYREEAKELLTELANSYLYKDILAVTGIKKPDLLQKLLQALAFQIGQEVSYNELAQLLGIDKNTVSKYLDLLEKAFIVFRLPSFSRNERNEIKNNRKIYFYDNGIRNSIIQNLNPLPLRNDQGALWENFLVAERVKSNSYRRNFRNYYFWRTLQKQEIDFIEEGDGIIKAFEFKWKATHRDKVPLAFTQAYQAEAYVIDSQNFNAFIRCEEVSGK